MRTHYKGLIGWSIGMILLIISGMAKFSAYSSTGQSTEEILKAFPKPFLAILGIQGLDLTTVIGFFGILYLYMVLLASIHAAMLGSEIISKEERDRTGEFLFTKPIARHKVISQKLIAGMLNIVILNIVTLITSIFTVEAYAGDWGNDRMVAILVTGVLLMQILFFSIGAALAGLFKNPKMSSIVATVILLVTYIIWVIIDLNSSFEALKYLTPFDYLEASRVIADDCLGTFNVILLLVVSMILTASTYYTYTRRDLKT
jgi:ABC-2 type transport system permease protein